MKRASQTVTTLAQKIGTTCHVSPLMRQLVSLAGKQPISAWLLRTAIALGCHHYASLVSPTPNPCKPEAVPFGREEIAIALCLGHLPYNPQYIRVAAELLSAQGNSPKHIAHLANQERCQAVVRHIAESGQFYEPDNPFWRIILNCLRKSQPLPAGILPHRSRFISHTGLTRDGSSHIEWIRPKSG